MTGTPAQPQNAEAAFVMLQSWWATSKQLAELKVEEVVQRKQLATFYFPSPREGTNRLDIGFGYDLKLEHKFNRSIDEASLDNVKASDIKRLKLPWDDLIVYKPELSLSTYRSLTAEQKKWVDENVIELKDATPSLSIVPRTGEPQAELTAGADVPVTTEAVNDAPAFVVVEDMDAAVAGNYYEDGDGDWWLCISSGESPSDEKEWQQVTNPYDPPPTPAKTTRGRKARK